MNARNTYSRLHEKLHEKRILILDFGSQYSQLIARRVREIGVYCELHPFDQEEQAIRDFAPAGIILAGGPQSVHEAGSARISEAVLALDVPILGICYGMQALAVQLGGAVERSGLHEFGHARIDLLGKSRLLDGIYDHQDNGGVPGLDVWMSHGDKVSRLPAGFSLLASTPSCEIAAMADDTRRRYGVQFHPEVTHTRQGMRILSRFVLDICGCEALWTAGNIVVDAIERIRAEVGDKQVLLGLSGGVDSSVVAALLHRAIGPQLTCVFVDNGLLRLNEGDQVMAMFAENFNINVIRVDAEREFLRNLQGEVDPERKRKIIGRTFIEVFDAQAGKLQGISYLAQGTIYPDVIESAAAKSGKAEVIKSHHNVGGLPERMNLRLLEPLRELFKDEVRKIGLELGLPHDMVYRHPFPGPGLGVRILGEVNKTRADLLRRADAIFIEELRNTVDEASGKSWYDLTSQAFAVFLPVKSVGVVGDGRRYAFVISLRAVETIDFMTARWAHLPHDLLETVSRRIINEIEDISRVTYDISSKPPATIEWE